MSTGNYLIERMEKLDRDIMKLERDVEFMQKQTGKKLQKIGLLREEYRKVVDEYKASNQEAKEA